MKRFFSALAILLLSGAAAAGQQNSASDEGGRVLALENAWDHALEEKDTKALGMLWQTHFCPWISTEALRRRANFWRASRRLTTSRRKR